VRPDRKAVSDRRHAGTLIGLAIDGDQTLEAGTHATVKTPPRAAWGVPVEHDAISSECRSDALAAEREQRLAIVEDGQRLAAATNLGTLEAHRMRSVYETYIITQEFRIGN
jgi:hypothetical protein